MTMRLAAVFLIVVAACAPARPAAPPPAPSEEPVSAPPPIAATPVRMDIVRTCAVRDGALVEVSATVNRETGDTLVDGKPFSSVFPLTGEYAGPAEWFVDHIPFDYQDRLCYMMYGLPRSVEPGRLRRVWVHRGVPVFAETEESDDWPAVLYVPVAPGCRFQAYQTELVRRRCGFGNG